MNTNTANALKEFLSKIPIFACQCSIRERDSGHHVDCPYEDIKEIADNVISAINTDETIPR